MHARETRFFVSRLQHRRQIRFVGPIAIAYDLVAPPHPDPDMLPMNRAALYSSALLLLGVVAITASGQEELPTDRLLRSLHPTADVNDFAGLLSPSEKASLENRCKELREKTGAQLAVVTLKSL